MDYVQSLSLRDIVWYAHETYPELHATDLADP